MKELKVKLTFTESILGTCPNNKDIYTDYIGSKSPDAATIEEEIACLGVDTVAEKGMTIFPKDEQGTPFLYDYQIKGFFKDTCGGLRKVKNSESSKIKAYKKEIDKLIFIKERNIPFEDITNMGVKERSLRAQTMQGDRITLAKSEEINADSKLTFTIIMLCDEHEKAVREWLDYGRFSGIGQWRNAGHGTFTWEELGMCEIKFN